MSFALFQTALLLPLELSLNRLLALDPASSARLARLEGRTLAVHVTQPQVVLYIGARTSGLHLGMIHEGAPDASLHGSLPALLGLLVRRADVDNLRSYAIELRGNTSFVQELQALLLSLEIDWEYQLSKLIGSIPTGFVSEGFQQARDLLRTTGSRLKEDSIEFLHEETRLFPAAAELDAFYDDVSELVLRIDRLQARLDRLAR